jgi:hypothetical protein
VTELHNAASSRASKRLWPNCLALFRECITKEDFDFYTSIDRAFSHREYRVGNVTAYGAYHTGGILDMLVLILHVSAGITSSGTIDFVQSHQEFLDRSPASVIPAPSFQCYYEALSQYDRSSVDSLLDDYGDLLDVEREHMRACGKQFGDDLARELYTTVSVSVKVKAGFATKIEHLMKDQIKLYEKHGDVFGGAQEQAASCPHSAFRHSVDYRTVNLRDQEYELTPLEAQVIKVLHEAWLNETPSVSVAYIIGEVAPNTSHTKLKHVFRNATARTALVSRGQTKGTCRLALE